MDLTGAEFIVVGAGLSGLTVARKLTDMGRKVVVLEKRDHIGGLCSEYIDAETGIAVHRWGTHVLHSSSPAAIAFLSQHCKLNHYRHRVFSRVGRKVYPFPVNLDTLNRFYEFDFGPQRAKAFFKIVAAQTAKRYRFGEDRRRLPIAEPPANFEEAMIAKMGEHLYSTFVEGYSRKQWGMEPRELPVELAERVVVRTDFNGDYFADHWQGVPVDGYTNLFSSLTRGFSCVLGVDFPRDVPVRPPMAKVVYTGPLDAYFGFRFGQLPWRCVKVESEVCAVGDYQGAAVINFPDQTVPYTRVHEFRHLHPERRRVSSRKTVIAPEFSASVGEPAYPVDPEGELAKRYREAAILEPNTFFLGRLGTYRYLNMDTAVTQALQLAERLCGTT